VWERVRVNMREVSAGWECAHDPEEGRRYGYATLCLCEMILRLLCNLSESTVESPSRVWRVRECLDLLQSERDR